MLTMVAVGLYNYDAFRDYRATLARAVLALALEAPLIFVAMLLYKQYLFARGARPGGVVLQGDLPPVRLRADDAGGGLSSSSARAR